MRTEGTEQRETDSGGENKVQSRERLTARVRTEGTEQWETDSESENRRYRAERD